MKLQTLWVDKYQPKTLDDYICPKSIKDKIQSYIDNKDLPHLIFEGSFGLGKTSLAKLIVELVDASKLYINASLNTSIDIIRNDVDSFCSKRSSKGLKVVILDECERLSLEAQDGLKAFVENFQDKDVRFIFTTNNIDKVNSGLKDRCILFSFEQPSLVQLRNKLIRIIKLEQIKVIDKETVKDDLQKLIEENDYSIRASIKALQECCSTGTFIYVQKEDSLSLVNQITTVICEHELPRWQRFKLIKEVIAENHVRDFETLYKGLFNTMDKWVVDEHYPDVVKFIHEYSYKSKVTPNREICFLALISDLL